MQGLRRFFPRLQDIGHFPAPAALLLRGERKSDETIELTGQAKSKAKLGIRSRCSGEHGEA